MKLGVSFFIIILLCVVSYGNSIRNEFVFDDIDVILKNEALHDINDFKAIVTTNYWHTEANAGLYRPFIFLTYAIDYHFWQDNPIGYHISNIAAHIGCCMMLFLLFAFMMKSTGQALIATVLFAVHPVHTEAVSGIVGRAEVFSALFFIIAWFFYLKGYDRGYFNMARSQYWLFSNYALLSYAAYFLALCSKENSVTMPAVAGLSLYFFEKSFSVTRLKNILLSLIPYAFIFALYMSLRWMVIGSIGPVGTEQFFYGKPYHTVFFTMMTAFAWYWKLLILPTDLLCIYRHWKMFSSFFEWEVIVSCCIILIWVLCAVWFLFKRRPWQFWLMFLLVTLLPVSNVIIRFGDIMAERFLYLPSIGYIAFFVLLAMPEHGSIHGMQRAYRRPVMVCTIVIVLLFTMLTIARNTTWKNGIIFWKTAIKDIPDSYPAYYNLAVASVEKNDYPLAVEALKKSIQIHPQHHEARKYLAILYSDMGMYDLAITHNKILLEYQPHEDYVYRNLAVCYLKQQEYDKAVAICQEGLQKARDKKAVYNALIRVYKNLKQYDKALKVGLEALNDDPNNIDAHLEIGTCFERLDEYKLAEDSFRKVLALDQKNIEALDKLASIYFKQANYREAINIWRHATKWYPKEESFWYYIGLAYERMNENELAKKSWANIQRSDDFKNRIKSHLHKMEH